VCLERGDDRNAGEWCWSRAPKLAGAEFVRIAGSFIGRSGSFHTRPRTCTWRSSSRPNLPVTRLCPARIHAALIAFIDLSRFAVQSQRVEDAEIATRSTRLRECSARGHVSGRNDGEIIGDAALVVFPSTPRPRGSRAPGAQRRVRSYHGRARLGVRFSAKAHFGTAIAGDFGPGRQQQRLGVVGRAVNATAMLRSRESRSPPRKRDQLFTSCGPASKRDGDGEYVAIESTTTIRLSCL